MEYILLLLQSPIVALSVSIIFISASLMLFIIKKFIKNSKKYDSKFFTLIIIFLLIGSYFFLVYLGWNLSGYYNRNPLPNNMWS